ncbi:MAG: hypothetical protein ACP5NZ_04525 [Nanobdellota archaeon]
MEKREVILYIITILAFLAFVYIVIEAFSKNTGLNNEESTGITGKLIMEINEGFNVGDKINGRIILKNTKGNPSGIIFLIKDDSPVITKTFNLQEVDELEFIEINKLIDYSFQEEGKYELFFSVPDLNMNVKKEITVK